MRRGTPLLVSIITPSFNQAPYLLDTLRSVAEQDYPRIEHLVMDGGSSDGSVEILTAWAKSHPIQWHSAPDDGQADAIQRGIEMATGDVVAWLNSDDIYLDPRAISDVMVLFDHQDVSAVTGGGWYVSTAGKRLRRIPVRPDRIGFSTLRSVDRILQPATFIRRDVALMYPIDTTLRYAFDWDLFIRMSRDHRFIPIQRDIAGYRVHEAGKTVSGSGPRQRELLDVARRYNSRSSAGYLRLLMISSVRRMVESLPGPVRGAVGWFVATEPARVLRWDRQSKRHHRSHR